jgi:uncharacterized membrane protein
VAGGSAWRWQQEDGGVIPGPQSDSPWWSVVPVARVAVQLAICATTAFLARRKNYSVLVWFFAAGVMGLIVLVLLPVAQSARQRLIGNLIGAGILLSFACMLIASWLVSRLP